MRAAAVLRQTVASNDMKTLKYLQLTSDSGSFGRSKADQVYAPVEKLHIPVMLKTKIKQIYCNKSKIVIKQ